MYYHIELPLRILSYLVSCMYLLAYIDLSFLSSLYVFCFIKIEKYTIFH